MLPFGMVFLIPAIFAAEYGIYGDYRSNTPSNVPMDYNDGLSISPNSNFIYNFEQLRRDQPPQLEMREESMGRYMYRPTTTSEPAPDSSPVPVNRRVESKPEYFSQPSNWLPPPGNWYNPHWNPSSAQSTTMQPPPPAPQLNDFSDSFNNHASSYFAPSPRHSDHNLPESRNFYQSLNQHSSSPQELQDPRDSLRNFGGTFPSQYTIPTATPVQTAPTTSSPIRQDISQRFKEFTSHKSSPGRGQPHTQSRGHHKFNWNDLSDTQTQNNPATQQPNTMLSPPAVNQNRGPPPPAPTLSPWNDGFGK